VDGLDAWPSKIGKRFGQVRYLNRIENSKLLRALTVIGLVSAVTLLDRTRQNTN